MKIDFLRTPVNMNKGRDDVCYGWRSMGLLDGLSGELEKKVAVSYEKMAHYLLDKHPNTYCACGVELAVTILPIIRRVVTGTQKELKNPKRFLDFCMRFANERADHYENFHKKHLLLDIEAVFAADISDYAIGIIKEE